MFKVCTFVSLFLLYTGLQAAASSSDSFASSLAASSHKTSSSADVDVAERIDPLGLQLNESNEQAERLSLAIRSNDTAYVREHVQPHLHKKYNGGRITLLHVLVAMEQVHRDDPTEYDPKDMIDIFGQYNTFHYMCDQKADVGDPIFHYMCTGKQREGIIHTYFELTPLELAARLGNIKTLAAIVQYRGIYHAVIKKNQAFNTDSDANFTLFSAIAEFEKDEGVPTAFYETGYIFHVIKTFGVKGIRMLHNHEHKLFKHLKYAIKREEDGAWIYVSPMDLFKMLHPDKLAEIADLMPKPKPERSISDDLRSLRDWFWPKNETAPAARGFEEV